MDCEVPTTRFVSNTKKQYYIRLLSDTVYCYATSYATANATLPMMVALPSRHAGSLVCFFHPCCRGRAVNGSYLHEQPRKLNVFTLAAPRCYHGDPKVPLLLVL